MRRIVGTVLLIALVVPAANACSLCEGLGAVPLTFRQESALPEAKVILHGTITASKLVGISGGTSDFAVVTPIRTTAATKDRKALVLPRYLPVEDKAKPPHYLVFCDLDGDKVDPYRGVKLAGPKSAAYAKKAISQDAKDPVASLVFFFAHLDDADPEVSRDAFVEFAKTADADIARAASKLDAKKLRGWLDDPKTPAVRLNVYAMLLGHCGGEEDVSHLRTLIESKEPRYAGAADGVLAGYMARKPKEGWSLAKEIIGDPKRPLLLRLAVLRTMKFAYGADAKSARPHVVEATKALLAEPDLADLAIENLRQWKIGDHTPTVLGLFGKKGYDSPLLQRGIIRYALCATPSAETKAFLAERRKADAETVADVEEGLKYERR